MPGLPAGEEGGHSSSGHPPGTVGRHPRCADMMPSAHLPLGWELTARAFPSRGTEGANRARPPPAPGTDWGAHMLRGKSGDAFSCSAVLAHACVLGRMLFLSAWLCGFVHGKGGEGIDTVQGWARGRCLCAVLTMGLGLAGCHTHCRR